MGSVDLQKDNLSGSSQHGYGLDMMNVALWGNDYGWTEPKPFRKVVLVNPKDCENKIDLMTMMSAWRDTGHAEWEALISYFFIKAVVDALNSGSDEADITTMFTHDLLASRNRVFTQQQIYDHVISWFDIIEENDEEVKVKFRIC